ncbi:hypothetical protein OROHE_016935 [Orobanche hederae]
MGSGNSNDLHTAVNRIKDFPANLTFIQVGPNIKVGVATFYSTIHFYNLKPTLQQVLPLSFTIREVQEIGLQAEIGLYPWITKRDIERHFSIEGKICTSCS